MAFNFNFNTPKTTASSGFNFGNPTTVPSSTTGGLFGSAPPPTSNNLFGSQPAQPSTTTSAPAFGNIFGSQPASNQQSSAPGGLFGSQPAATQQQSSTSGGIFGSQAKPAPTPGGGLFGSTTAAPNSNLFGGAQTAPAQPAPTTTTSASSFGNLFGGQPTQQSSTSNGIFGGQQIQQTTTSSGIFGNQAKPATTPATGIFGSTTTNAPSGNVFGTQTSTVPISSQPTLNLFGQTALIGGTTQPSTVPPATSSTLQGATVAITTSTAPTSFTLPASTGSTLAGNFFGTQTTQPSTTVPATTLNSLGGQYTTQQHTPAQQFSQYIAQQPAPAQQQQSTIFGGVPKPATAPSAGLFASTTNTQGGNLSGQTTASVTNVAISEPTSSQPVLNIFGQAQTTAAGGETAKTMTSSFPPFGTLATTIGAQIPSTTTTTTTGAPTPFTLPTASIPATSSNLFGLQTVIPQATSTPVAPIPAQPALNLLGPKTSSLGTTQTNISSTTSTSLPPFVTSNTITGTQPLALTTTTTTPIPFSLPTATSTPIAANSGALTLSGAKPTTTSDELSKLTYKDLEDSLNRLIMDFTNQEKQFLDEVLELNAYDTVLRQNQQKLFTADEEITQLEKEKDFFMHEVEVIAYQQKELEGMVEMLEKTLGLSDYTDGEPLGIRANEITTNADLKRQDIYRLQVTVDAQLKQADDDINDLCEQMTELQAWTEDGSKTDDSQGAIMDQIRQILKKQLDSLNWVDKQSEELSTRVKKLSAEMAS